MGRGPHPVRTQGVITSVIATAAKHGIDAVDYLAARARSPDPGLASSAEGVIPNGGISRSPPRPAMQCQRNARTVVDEGSPEARQQPEIVCGGHATV